MKITIVQGAFLPVPPLIGGAVEKVWFGLGKEFVKQGHQVTHISRCYGDLPIEEVIDGVLHLRLPGFDTPSSLVVLKLFDLIYSWRVLRSLPESDILVTNTFWLPMLARSPQYGALYVHIQRYPKGQMRFYRHAARLQTVSQAIAHAITVQDPLSVSKVKIIANPLTEIPIPLSSQHERKPWILYVGRIHPEKGINLLLQAFKALIKKGISDWRLVIVGPWETKLGGGGAAYYEQLQTEAHSISHFIDWSGPVFRPQALYLYYQQASLFVYPSLANFGEASPLAPVEAMSCGCPPLVSDLDCFKDYIEDNKTGFIFKHNVTDPVASLTAKIYELISDNAKLYQISQHCLATAQNYSVEHIAKLYLDDFASLIL